MEVISIGPLMIKWQLLMLIMSALSGYFVLSIFLKVAAIDHRKRLLDDLATTFLVSILIWKFSAILFDFNSIIHEPKLLLFYTGGTNGWLLAGIYAIVILGLKTRKHSYGWAFYVAPALTWFIASSGIFALLKLLTDDGGLYIAGNFILSAVMILIQFWNAKKQRDDQAHIYKQNPLVMLLGYSLGLFALSLMEVDSDPLWIGLTLRQLLLILVISVSLIAKIIGENHRQIH